MPKIARYCVRLLKRKQKRSLIFEEIFSGKPGDTRCAGGGNRTHTHRKVNWILSPVCLINKIQKS
ncbi:hypothetical protein ACFLR7_05680, partial [Acidobacteriota bacterium]